MRPLTVRAFFHIMQTARNAGSELVLRSSSTRGMWAFTLGIVLGVSGPAGAWQMLDDRAEGSFALGGVVEVTDPDALDFRILLNGDERDNPSSYYVVHLTDEQATISRVEGDKSVPLGAPGKLPPTVAGQEIEFSLHRDDWRIAFIWNRRVVARAFDGTLTGSALGHDAAGGVQVRDVWMQPVGEVYVVDNFEREEGVQDEWEHLGGSWELISLREDRQAGQMHADKSANAFSYYGLADGAGLAAMGSWFWRNCDYSLAVRARGDAGAVGLGFYVQDKDNFLLLRWDNRFGAAEDGPALSLVAVVDGKHETLARRHGGYFPDQWYHLRVRVCDEHVLAFVDDQLMLQATTDLFGRGMLGMYVEGKQGVWFDDALVTDWNHLAEDFAGDPEGRWVTAAGEWSLGEGAARPATEAPAMLVTGSARWTSYALRAQVSGDSGGVGLIAGWRGPHDAWLFRWAARGAAVEHAGKAQIVRLTAEGERIVAERDLPPDIAPSGVAAVIAEPDHIAGLLGDRLVVDVVVDEPVRGGVGLYAAATQEAVFTSLTLEPLPRRTVARVTKEFTDMTAHWEMGEWAGTTHAWVKPPDDASPQVWWTKGDFHGPLQVRFELKQLGQVEGTMTVTLEGEQSDAARGAQLAITATKGSRALALKLTGDGRELAAGEVQAAGATCPVSVERRGSHIVVAVDGKAVLTAVWPRS